MASELALARSYYAWITKLVLLEGVSEKALPEAMSTLTPMILEHIDNVEIHLHEQKHLERRQYWKNLFENLGETECEP